MTALTIRRIGAELLDDPRAGPAVVEESLRNIVRSNRWFGGRAALCWGLREALRDAAPACLTLLDIGSGLGDGPHAAAAWAARRGIRLVPMGLERHPVAARLALAEGLPTVVACAGAPPVGPKSVDIVSLCMVAHHFEPESVIELLQVCDRIARLAVVVADLRRAALATAAFRCGARALRFDPVTTADGVTSIRRGFTADELADLLRRAGLAASVARRPGWRLVATWRPRPA